MSGSLSRIVAMANAATDVSRALARIGWEIRSVDIDMVSRRMDMSVHRDDGRWVHLRISDGACVLERNQKSCHSSSQDAGYKRGARIPAPSVGWVYDRFLGRSTFASPVAAIRALAFYIGDNSVASRLEAKAALRPILAAWHAGGDDE